MSVKTWAYSSLLLALFSQGVMAKDVTVFAAASLTNALNEISADYKKRIWNEYGDVICLFFYIGSSNCTRCAC